MSSMMPLQPYNPALQYAQYHDMRTPIQAGAPVNSQAVRGSDYGHYSQPQSSANSPHHAPTPPEDPNKPYLPSISNLLGIADGEKTSQPPSESRSPPQQRLSPGAQQPTPTESTSSHHLSSAAETLPMAAGPHPVKPTLPPTPPMRSDSMPDPGHSPSTISSNSSFSGPPNQMNVMNNMDPNSQRGHGHNLHVAKPMQHPQSVYHAPPFGMPQYMPSPSPVGPSHYYSPEIVYHNGLSYQRPLPTDFHPAVMQAPMLPHGMIPAGAWDHRHYLNATAPYPTLQERYVCPICKKAFSRPSSLKIHSHSHTGEKPFKCPHAGCGKAFSVRSNMKRHERGCHTQ